MKKTVTFKKPENVTPPGLDGMEILFPFSVVDSSLIGLPEEKQRTNHYKVTMGISGSLISTWQLDEKDLDNIVKVLFWHAKQRIEKMISDNSLPPDDKHVLHTENTPPECPFEVEKIPTPEDFSFEVEAEKPRIGF